MRLPINRIISPSVGCHEHILRLQVPVYYAQGMQKDESVHELPEAGPHSLRVGVDAALGLDALRATSRASEWGAHSFRRRCSGYAPYTCSRALRKKPIPQHRPAGCLTIRRKRSGGRLCSSGLVKYVSDRVVGAGAVWWMSYTWVRLHWHCSRARYRKSPSRSMAKYRSMVGWASEEIRRDTSWGRHDQNASEILDRFGQRRAKKHHVSRASSRRREIDAIDLRR